MRGIRCSSMVANEDEWRKAVREGPERADARQHVCRDMGNPTSLPQESHKRSRPPWYLNFRPPLGDCVGHAIVPTIQCIFQARVERGSCPSEGAGPMYYNLASSHVHPREGPLKPHLQCNYCTLVLPWQTLFQQDSESLPGVWPPRRVGYNEVLSGPCSLRSGRDQRLCDSPLCLPPGSPLHRPTTVPVSPPSDHGFRTVSKETVSGGAVGWTRSLNSSAPSTCLGHEGLDCPPHPVPLNYNGI